MNDELAKRAQACIDSSVELVTGGAEVIAELMDTIRQLSGKTGDRLPEVEVDHGAMREAAVEELTELEKWVQASRVMYAEMAGWYDQGHRFLLMEKDGEELSLRPIA